MLDRLQRILPGTYFRILKRADGEAGRASLSFRSRGRNLAPLQINALGDRSSIAAAELGCRLFRHGRLWDFFWPHLHDLDTFGDSYRAYISRTGRIFPPHLLNHTNRRSSHRPD